MSRRYKLAELAAEVGVNIRTITGWVNKGALPRAGRGPMVAYDEAYRMRFLAVARLRREQKLPFPAIVERLARATPAEIAHLAGHGPPPRIEPSAAASHPARPDDGTTERWERTRLVPGLELHVATDADEAARRMAQAIRVMFGPKGAA